MTQNCMYIALEIYKTKLPLLRSRRAVLWTTRVGEAAASEPRTRSIKYAHPALNMGTN